MRTKIELRDAQLVLIDKCREIIDLAKSEIRELTEEEQKELDKMKEEIKALREELDKEEEMPQPETDPDTEEPEDDVEVPEDDDMKKEEEEVKACRPDEKRNLNNNKLSKKIMENKFNLLKELRSAYEMGKSINLAEYRAYTVNDEGEDVVQTDLFDIWEPLRTKNVLVEAGAQYITGIKNNIQIPLMSAVSCSFAGETDAATDGSAAFSQKFLSPKRITAKYPVSLELLAQDSAGVEAAIRADIIKAINAKLEATILGAGDGKVGGANVAPVGMFNGKEPVLVNNFAALTGLEATIEGANVYGECKYIVAPTAKAALRNMPKSAKYNELVMENGAIDGTPVLSTSHVPADRLIYGDFSNLVIATWDNVQLDVVRDVASVGNGVVTIVVNAFVDAVVVRPEAFAFGKTKE